MRALRALTLKHPWPFAIVALGKRLENRTWRPRPDMLKPGEWFCLHGGKMPAANTARDRDELNLIRGTALKLIDQHQDRAVSWMEGRGLSNITLRDAIIPGIMAIAQYGGIVSPDMDESDDPWFEGPLAWRLDDLVELPEPIPCRGAQGLWLVPDELLPRVRDGFRADRQRRVPAAMP